jgi:hypothetical protein
MYTNERMLEVETLGPLNSLTPECSLEHVERWYLFPDVVLAEDSDEAIDQVVKPLVGSVK